jgi:hypothetical protein
MVCDASKCGSGMGDIIIPTKSLTNDPVRVDLEIKMDKTVTRVNKGWANLLANSTAFRRGCMSWYDVNVNRSDQREVCIGFVMFKLTTLRTLCYVVKS